MYYATVERIMATMSLRLDAQTVSAIDRISARTGKSKSDIVREAIADFVAKNEESSRGERPYDKVAHLIGSVDSGGMQLSTNTGRRVAKLLQEEWDARRRADRRRATRRAAR
jgi:predicted DNA-binding protein